MTVVRVDTDQTGSFDFEEHSRLAVEAYREVHPRYERFAGVVQHILEETLGSADARVHSIQARAKDIESFGKKASRPSEANPNRPEYAEPLTEITDLAGIRVITFSPRTLSGIDQLIGSEFLVREKSDKGEELAEEHKFGYKSIHYTVNLKPERVRLPEYGHFADMIAEIQVRTILQHAWAELEHDIQYKSAVVIPTSIRRRFMALAGLFEIADREFDAVQAQDEQLREEARESVKTGRLESVEITPDALKSYLDKTLGADARIASFSYNATARELREMGFEDFQQIDECISGFDADGISRRMWGHVPGQIRKFEIAMLAGMGPKLIERHPWGRYQWFSESRQEELERLIVVGIEVRTFDPAAHGSDQSHD